MNLLKTTSTVSQSDPLTDTDGMSCVVERHKQ
jgi:hypothetical protein